MSDVSLEIADNVATLVIDRPHARNAISLMTITELERALDEVERRQPRVLVFQGAGDHAFVSGGDLKDLATLTTVEQASSMALRMRVLLDRLATLPALTVAAINGHAIGGGAEVALACDIRIASDHVSIAFSQSQLAIMPAWGGIERLANLVGRSRALSLLLTPQRLNAKEASEIGLVNESVPRVDFQARIVEVTSAVARVPHGVVNSVKSVVDTVQPPVTQATTEAAIAAFAAAWVAPAHWAAVAGARALRDART